MREHTGSEFPQDPREQLDLRHRRRLRLLEHRPRACSTAARSGSPRTSAPPSTSRRWSSATSAWTPAPASASRATRPPATRASTATTSRTPRARTSSPASATPSSLADMAERRHGVARRAARIMSTLEQHYRDMCDIEFTVERGKLWMLQTRVGKRTPEAAFRIAAAHGRRGPDRRGRGAATGRRRAAGAADVPAASTSPRPADLLAKGMNASPGAAVGKIVFDSATAVEWAERGEDVILVRKETNPDDLSGMMAARGVLTSRGGKTSHAAVVARGMGRTCVCGAESSSWTPGAKFTVRGRHDPRRGRRDLHRRHHRRGLRRRGAGRRTRSVVRHFEGEELDDPLVEAVPAVMEHADGARRLKVRANADTPEDAARARRFGAEGIGLCRTEHMFLGERRQLVENLIVAERRRGPPVRAGRAAAPAAAGLHRHPRGDGRPPGHHPPDRPTAPRVPARLHRPVSEGGAAGRRAARSTRPTRSCSPHVQRLHESNPMLGLRGVRLGIADPRPVRDAGPRDPGGDGRPARRRRRPAAGDHGPAGGQRARVRRRHGLRSRRWPRRSRPSVGRSRS